MLFLFAVVRPWASVLLKLKDLKIVISLLFLTKDGTMGVKGDGGSVFFFVLFFLVGHATWLPHRMFSFRTSLLCFEKFHYLYHETCLYRCQTKNTDGRKKKKTWYNGSVSTAGARSSRRSPNVRYVGLPKYRASWRKLLEKRMTCRIGLVDLFF